MNIDLDGKWTITKDLFDYIIEHFPCNQYSNILEIGSGRSTFYFREAGYNITSIEENKEFAEQNQSTYLPIVNNYYEADKFKKIITSKKWDILLIDGPYKKNRQNILRFGKDWWPGIIIVDDTHRQWKDLADKIKGKNNKSITIQHSKEPFHDAMIIWRNNG